MKLKILGAAGEVTGSSYLLTSGKGETVLIDYGMFQGTEDLEKMNYIPLDIDYQGLSAVILTHAHLDHCGRLPVLFNNGFENDIWMTPPTLDLTELSLYDAAKIIQEDEGRLPLYDKEDVDQVVSHTQTAEYGEKITIGSIEFTYRDAGHILGSACIEITDTSSPEGSNKIVFSGDLGNTPQDLIRKTEVIESSDFAVMESTYGDRTHTSEDPSEVILSEINEVEKNGGTLLIPAFSIERSQEVLHRISHLKEKGKIGKDTQIFFDSPMGAKATAIFEKYREYFNSELLGDFAKSHPFHFDGLKYVSGRAESLRIREMKGAKVIIAGSGMMNGGRILDHAINFLPLQNTRLLFVGYQAEGTTGREIQEGGKIVNIKGVNVEINATITDMQSMSSHADQPRLIKWLSTMKGLKMVFLTHGEQKPREILKEKIVKELNIEEIELPFINQEFEL